MARKRDILQLIPPRLALIPKFFVATLRPLSLFAVVLFLSGCEKKDEKIKVYRVAKAPLELPAPDKAPMATGGDSQLPPANSASTSSATIPAPAGWEAQPPSQMRQASFLVRDEKGAVADISLVTLGAAAGNVLENVNRWLSQLSQPAVTDEKLAGMVQHLPTSRGDVVVVDLAGAPEKGDATKDGRIVAAMTPEEGKTSFFKMRGNAALVGAQKENFLKWVKAVREAPTASGATDSLAPPPPPSADAPKIKWELPQGWVTGAPAPMRYASFTVAGENNQTADISVVTFPGEGGRDADNVNRWRQQIGLPPADAAALQSMISPMKSGDSIFSTVDMTGANARVLAGWIRRDERTWFFKLSGPKEVVEKEKAKFVEFLQSIRF